MEFLSASFKLTAQASLAVFILLTYSQQDWAHDALKLGCGWELEGHPNGVKIPPVLQETLRAPGTTPSVAINAMVVFLRSASGNAEQKYKIWQLGVVEYNEHHLGQGFWIKSPCALTLNDDIVCWGDIPGSLLIFLNDPKAPSASIGISYNPDRPDPSFIDQGRVKVNLSDTTIYWNNRSAP